MAPRASSGEARSRARPTFIFDYDGTLCDTLDAICDALALSFRHFIGQSPDIADLRALIGSGKTLEESIQALHLGGEPLDRGALDGWIAFYRREYKLHAEAKVTLFEGAAECLDRLGSIGDLVLLSNKGIEAVEASLRQFGIRDRFRLVLAEEPGHPRKPQADVFWKRIAPLLPGAEAADCVVIGDTAADLEFARNIGAQSCFARYGYGDAAACEAIGFTHGLRTISDLPAIFCDDNSGSAASGVSGVARARR